MKRRVKRMHTWCNHYSIFSPETGGFNRTLNSTSVFSVLTLATTDNKSLFFLVAGLNAAAKLCKTLFRKCAQWLCKHAMWKLWRSIFSALPPQFLLQRLKWLIAMQIQGEKLDAVPSLKLWSLKLTSLSQQEKKNCPFHYNRCWCSLWTAAKNSSIRRPHKSFWHQWTHLQFQWSNIKVVKMLQVSTGSSQTSSKQLIHLLFQLRKAVFTAYQWLWEFRGRDLLVELASFINDIEVTNTVEKPKAETNILILGSQGRIFCRMFIWCSNIQLVFYYNLSHISYVALWWVVLFENWPLCLLLLILKG